jgi:Cu2+-containing amine oxidase
MASSKKAVKAVKSVKPKPKALTSRTAKPVRSGTGAPVPAASAAPGKTAAPAKSAAPAKGAVPARPLAPDIAKSDPSLFDPLTPGEIADALRTLTEDRRLGTMSKVGRYRVICTEPLVVKPPHWMAGHRLVRVVVYDYAADRAVDACVDLDAGVVAHLELNKGQPMLSRDEEALAVSIAMVDDRVRQKLALGDVPQSTLHYWGRTSEDLAFARRSAAVVFGRADGHASLVAVVDLLENIVTQVVAAEQW